MAIASYTTDLTTHTLAETSTTGWAEPTSAKAGGLAAAEIDYFIHGVGCISKTFNATGLGGLAYTGTTMTIPTDGAVMVWCYYAAPNAIGTLANGGQRVLIGSSSAAYKAYYVGGSNTYAYGGWRCYPANPTITADNTVGTPTTTYVTAGYIVNSINAVARGNPFGVDVIRYGRCESRFSGGDLANGYATFNGYSLVNDLVSNRWGLVQYQDGGYLWQGLMTLGSGSAVDFRDANTQVLVANTTKVTSNFNKIEIRQTTSNIEWTSIGFLALGAVARGNLQVIDDCVVSINSCSFTGMGTFIFRSLSTILGSTFRGCQAITQGSATFTECVFDKGTGTTAVISNNVNSITFCEFYSNANHAIELTTPGTYSLSGCEFYGYGANGTTSAAVYNNSGGAITLNVSGGTAPTVRNGTNASTTVVASNTVTLTGLMVGSEVRAYVGIDPSTSTEIGGIESSGTSYSFGQSFSGQAGYIQVFALGYLPIWLDITYEANDINIPIQQSIDRVYKNPT